MHTEFLDLLVLHYESMQLLNGNAYAEYAGIKTYIDSLRTWCLNEQDYFQKESIERDARRVLELQKEEDLKHQPIIDVCDFYFYFKFNIMIKILIINIFYIYIYSY